MPLTMADAHQTKKNPGLSLGWDTNFSFFQASPANSQHTHRISGQTSELESAHHQPTQTLGVPRSPLMHYWAPVAITTHAGKPLSKLFTWLLSLIVIEPTHLSFPPIKIYIFHIHLLPAHWLLLHTLSPHTHTHTHTHTHSHSQTHTHTHLPLTACPAAVSQYPSVRLDGMLRMFTFATVCIYRA